MAVCNLATYQEDDRCYLVLMKKAIHTCAWLQNEAAYPFADTLNKASCSFFLCASQRLCNESRYTIIKSVAKFL